MGCNGFTCSKHSLCALNILYIVSMTTAPSIWMKEATTQRCTETERINIHTLRTRDGKRNRIEPCCKRNIRWLRSDIDIINYLLRCRRETFAKPSRTKPRRLVLRNFISSRQHFLFLCVSYRTKKGPVCSVCWCYYGEHLLNDAFVTSSTVQIKCLYSENRVPSSSLVTCMLFLLYRA